MITCPQCNILFEPRRNGQLFCSSKCAAPETGRKNNLPMRFCEQCGEEYKPKATCQKYCQNPCNAVGRLAKAECLWKKEERKCKDCGVVFYPNGPSQIYCKVEECATKRRDAYFAKIKEQKHKNKETKSKPCKQPSPSPEFELKSMLIGSYVYGWYQPGKSLPFYIGKGKDGRAWEEHEGARCEWARTSSTKVVIFRDNLTDQGARLIEAVLVNMFTDLGAPLLNHLDTTLKRQEIPPLEMQELVDQYRDPALLAANGV